jgi:cell division protein ZapA
MATVNVTVNGHNYSIACNDGEEDHLKRLAAMVDGKLQELVHMVGQIGDQRLMLMAALMLADELVSQQGKSGEADQSLAEIKATNVELQNRVNACEGEAAEHIEAAAKRVEAILNVLTQNGSAA